MIHDTCMYINICLEYGSAAVQLQHGHSLLQCVRPGGWNRERQSQGPKTQLDLGEHGLGNSCTDG